MSDLFHFDALTDRSALRSALRQLLDEDWVGPRDLWPSALASILVPVNVLDTGPDIVVRASMPGVRAEQLKITVSGSTLTVKGEIESESEFENATHLGCERPALVYARSLTPPLAVEADSAQAAFKMEFGRCQRQSAGKSGPRPPRSRRSDEVEEITRWEDEGGQTELPPQFRCCLQTETPLQRRRGT